MNPPISTAALTSPSRSAQKCWRFAPPQVAAGPARRLPKSRSAMLALSRDTKLLRRAGAADRKIGSRLSVALGALEIRLVFRPGADRDGPGAGRRRQQRQLERRRGQREQRVRRQCCRRRQQPRDQRGAEQFVARVPGWPGPGFPQPGFFKPGFFKPMPSRIIIGRKGGTRHFAFRQQNASHTPCLAAPLRPKRVPNGAGLLPKIGGGR